MSLLVISRNQRHFAYLNIILKKSDTGHGNYIEMIENFEKKNVCFNFNLSDRQVAGQKINIHNNIHHLNET